MYGLVSRSALRLVFYSVVRFGLRTSGFPDVLASTSQPSSILEAFNLDPASSKHHGRTRWWQDSVPVKYGAAYRMQKCCMTRFSNSVCCRVLSLASYLCTLRIISLKPLLIRTEPCVPWIQGLDWSAGVGTDLHLVCAKNARFSPYEQRLKGYWTEF